MDESSLTACSQARVQLALLLSLGPPAFGWYCFKWAGPFYISKQSRKCQNDMTTSQYDLINPH